MQFTEDLDRGLIHLHAVGRQKTDISFLENVSKRVRTHGLIEFNRIEPVVYVSNFKSRKAASFKIPNKLEPVILIATGHNDEKILEKILIAFSTNSRRNRSKKSVGLYLHSYGNVTNDKRHHLNGPFLSVCLAYCHYCRNTPLIDRINVAEKMCKQCKGLNIEDLAQVVRQANSRKAKIRKSVFKWLLEKLNKLIQSITAR